MNQKNIAIIILSVLVVILSGAVGYLVLVKKSAPVAEQTTTQTKTPTVASEPAEWPTYTNEQYNFSLKTPVQLQLLTTDNNSTVTFGDKDYQQVQLTNGLTDGISPIIKVVKNWRIPEADPYANSILPYKTVINDIVWHGFYDPTAGMPNCAQVQYQTLTPDQKNLIMISLFDENQCPGAQDQDPSKLALTLEKILATFQFTQTVPLIEYRNTDYGFSFALPGSWEGYSIVMDKWEGYPLDVKNAAKIEGPKILIRHPRWTNLNLRQDIPIMIFTHAQWDLIQQEKLSVGAAPIGPSELGRNANYVFALPARYNYAFPEGYEEVESILQSKPLKTF